MTVKVGEVYLVHFAYSGWLKAEVIDVQAPMLRLDPERGVREWLTSEDFEKLRPIKFGEWRECGCWPFKGRELIRA